MSSKPRSRSRKRFEQINHLVDDSFAKMPTATHAAALVEAWRHADSYGRFALSRQRLADTLGISKRHASSIVSTLVAKGYMTMLRKATGTRPPVYKLTTPSDC